MILLSKATRITVISGNQIYSFDHCSHDFTVIEQSVLRLYHFRTYKGNLTQFFFYLLKSSDIQKSIKKQKYNKAHVTTS